MKEEVHTMKVDELMTKSVVTLNVGDTVEKAATLMKEHNVGSIPVCEGNTIKGIITDRDITLKAVAVEKILRLKLLMRL